MRKTHADATVVTVDYNEPEAIAKAIERLNVGEDQQCIFLDLALVPVGGSGQVERQVYEVTFKTEVKDQDLAAALLKHGREIGVQGLGPADPLTALTYLSERPAKVPQVAVFKNKNGGLCHLSLEPSGGRLYIFIQECNPALSWDSGTIFLAVAQAAEPDTH